MIIQLNFLKIFLSSILVSSFSLICILGFSKENNQVCNTLITVLNINTSAYKNCLLQKSGDKFSREEINNCKKYYFTEIERLSYVYKNICKQ